MNCTQLNIEDQMPSRLAFVLITLSAACGSDPLPQPPDIPASLKPGQEVDPCTCSPRPYTNDGTLQELNCQYGWKVILTCSEACMNGAPQWHTLCGPLQ